MSYGTDKQTHTHKITHTQTDIDDHYTHATPVGVSNNNRVRLNEIPNKKIVNNFVSNSLAYSAHGRDVTVATHDQGGLLDVVATRDDLSLPPVEVVDVGLSDHRLLRWTTSLTKPSPVYTTRTSRPWRYLDADEFRAALMSSPLCHPDAWIDLDTDALVPLYDAETTVILDRLVPARTVTCRRRPSDPWFDQEGRLAKRRVRQLERVARSADVNSPPPPSGQLRQLSAAPIELCSAGSVRLSGPARSSLSVHHRDSSGDLLTH